MDIKTFLTRFGILFIAVAAGLFLYAAIFHTMQALGWMPPEINGKGFGYVVTYNTSFVVMGSIVLGFFSIFIRQNWRYALLLCPLYAPGLFAIAFTLINRA